MAFIFASVMGFLAPFLFQWAGGFFNPTPDAPQDCNVMEFLKNEKSVADFRACTTQSHSFDTRLERLSHKIPWFWIAFLLAAWAFLRNPLKGRVRDDSDDVTYNGQGGMEFLLTLIGQIMFFICLWAFLVRDKTSFMALVIGITVILLWYVLHKWLLMKYGQSKSERHSK